MKRLMAAALSAALFCGLFTGCAHQKEAIEININVPILTMDCVAYPECGDTSTFIQAAWDEFAAQYEKYDVSLKNERVNVFEQTEYAANIPDAYGTDLAPDLTFGGYFAISGYIYDGHAVPLDDIITDSIRSDFDETAWELSQGSNGRTYLMPFYSLENILCYNKELFRQCGLEEYISDGEEIQGWSLEEWEHILATLEEKLPENHYPMMMYAKNEQGDTHTMIQLRCKGSDFFDEDGLFRLNTGEGIAALQWIKDNYDKGYYPEHCEDLEVNDCAEMFVNGQIALYVWNSAIATSIGYLDVGFVNFPGEEASGVNSNWITGFMAFDNGDEKKVEVVKDFLRYIYETPGLLDYSAGGLPCSKSVMERWGDKVHMGAALADNAAYAVDFTANNPNWAGVRAAFWPHIHALLAGNETAAEAAAGIDDDCNVAITSVERTLHE